MLREDLSYAQIKDCAYNMAQKVAKVAIPMDLSLFKKAAPTQEDHGYANQPNNEEPVD